MKNNKSFFFEKLLIVSAIIVSTVVGFFLVRSFDSSVKSEKNTARQNAGQKAVEEPFKLGWLFPNKNNSRSLDLYRDEIVRHLKEREDFGVSDRIEEMSLNELEVSSIESLEKSLILQNVSSSYGASDFIFWLRKSLTQKNSAVHPQYRSFVEQFYECETRQPFTKQTLFRDAPQAVFDRARDLHKIAVAAKPLASSVSFSHVTHPMLSLASRIPEQEFRDALSGYQQSPLSMISPKTVELAELLPEYFGSPPLSYGINFNPLLLENVARKERIFERIVKQVDSELDSLPTQLEPSQKTAAIATLLAIKSLATNETNRHKRVTSKDSLSSWTLAPKYDENGEMIFEYEANRPASSASHSLPFNGMLKSQGKTP